MRALVAAVLAVPAVLLGFQAVRTAAVAHEPTRATIGAKLWPSHPAVVLDQTMAEIGALAARGRTLPPATLRKVRDIATRTPLAPEPFLINGAMLQSEGRDDQAERLFTEARSRDPRSDAARYFLTDRYFRTGRIQQALAEMAVFARLVPNGSAQFAPALAAFAKTPGAVPQVRKFFRSSPEFEPVVLAELAADSRNAELILALAGPPSGSRQGPAPPWQSRIVGELVAQGNFAKAYAVWSAVSGVRGGGGALFNPKFEQIAAPPPFNWSFASAGGVAEPADGRLRVIYYGRQDSVLAQQLLLLRPGRYRLAMTVTGQSAGRSALAWSLVCLPPPRGILSLPLKPESGMLAAEFAVPADCPAQRLELTGSAGDFPQSIDVTIGNFSLARGPGA